MASRMRKAKWSMTGWLLKLVTFTGAVIVVFSIVIHRLTGPVYQYSNSTQLQLKVIEALFPKKPQLVNSIEQDVVSPTNASEILFPNKPLVIWSNDYHISPINDLKHLLKPLGVTFIDKSLSGHCFVTNTCEGKKSLKVINRDNAMHLDPSLIPKFYEAYRNDPEMQTVDAFVCFHPASMCELFMPFNKSLIVIASTRYELGRFGVDRWTKWNHNLLQIARTPTNVVGGNNRYDVEYIKYFTGIQPQLLPSFCGYLSDKYAPCRPGFLLAPVHHFGFEAIFMSEYKALCGKTNCTAKLRRLREIYPSYKYSDLTSHSGIVYIPYQVSVMSMFEQYRMNIPLFFPSLELLTTWQDRHMVNTLLRCANINNVSKCVPGIAF